MLRTPEREMISTDSLRTARAGEIDRARSVEIKMSKIRLRPSDFDATRLCRPMWDATSQAGGVPPFTANVTVLMSQCKRKVWVDRRLKR